jgi:hydrogenase expression/formation protein HypC
MCLAVPAEVLSIAAADAAVVSIGGVRKTISTALLDAVEVGDYVLVHVGYALSLIDEAEARRTLQLLAAEGGIDPGELDSDVRATEALPA